MTDPGYDPNDPTLLVNIFSKEADDMTPNETLAALLGELSGTGTPEACDRPVDRGAVLRHLEALWSQAAGDELPTVTSGLTNGYAMSYEIG